LSSTVAQFGFRLRAISSTWVADSVRVSGTAILNVMLDVGCCLSMALTPRLIGAGSSCAWLGAV
jgi:hypothetical protein